MGKRSTDTTKDQPSAPGGYEHDLREAENAMAAAGHPDIALGMRRHSEAQRNMMQGVLVPMFVAMVEKTIGPKIDGLRTDVQAWAVESAARLQKIEHRLDESEADRADLRKRVAHMEQALVARTADYQSLLRAIKTVGVAVDNHNADHDGP